MTEFTFRAQGKEFKVRATVSGEAMAAANRQFLDGLNAPMGVWMLSTTERDTYEWVEGNFLD
jgi:hypothetical protein